MPEFSPESFDEPVTLAPHDPAWEQQFQEEAERVGEAIRGYFREIQHFGSTSIPGIKAKPIIGLLVGIDEDLPRPEMIAALQGLGYLYFGQLGRRPRWYLRKRGERNFNIHIVHHRGPVWQDNLLFRDFLRAHPDWRKRYEKAKVRAARAYGDNLSAYGAAKNDMMKRIMRAAYRWKAEQANRQAFGQLVGRRVVDCVCPADQAGQVIRLLLDDGSALEFSFANNRWSERVLSWVEAQPGALGDS